LKILISEDASNLNDDIRQWQQSEEAVAAGREILQAECHVSGYFLFLLYEYHQQIHDQFQNLTHMFSSQNHQFHL